jgi:hypothetical protein
MDKKVITIKLTANEARWLLKHLSNLANAVRDDARKQSATEARERTYEKLGTIQALCDRIDSEM